LGTVAPADRYLICSDGLSGVLDQGVIADVLGAGTPGQAVADLIGRVKRLATAHPNAIMIHTPVQA
jgi:serine/threonine protein phosphatase PrpC